jgi:hypothetical protein
MSVLASIDEIRGLAAKLLSIPEWVISEIQDYRHSITGERPAILTDTMLPTLEFLCFYKDMPEAQSYWWNRYNDLCHLPLLRIYLESIRKTIPLVGADGRLLHLHTVQSLKVFCRSYKILIDDISLKADILRAIDAERAIRASAPS